MQRKRANYMDKIHYGALQELLKHLGINPYEFMRLNEDKVEGWFPDLPDRVPKADIKELSRAIWGREKKNGIKWFRR